MHHTDRVNRIRAERANWFLASHDVLTGSPNRKTLLDRPERRCAGQTTDTGAGSFAVLCLDLDGFEAINATFGHPVSDTILIEVAQRLTRELREPDVVARTGGDEFIILLHDVDDEGAARISHRIIDSIAPPIVLGFPTELTISVTIGSAFAPRDAALADLLLARGSSAVRHQARAAWDLPDLRPDVAAGCRTGAVHRACVMLREAKRHDKGATRGSLATDVVVVEIIDAESGASSGPEK